MPRLRRWWIHWGVAAGRPLGNPLAPIEYPTPANRSAVPANRAAASVGQTAVAPTAMMYRRSRPHRRRTLDAVNPWLSWPYPASLPQTDQRLTPILTLRPRKLIPPSASRARKSACFSAGSCSDSLSIGASARAFPRSLLKKWGRDDSGSTAGLSGRSHPALPDKPEVAPFFNSWRTMAIPTYFNIREAKCPSKPERTANR